MNARARLSIAAFLLLAIAAAISSCAQTEDTIFSSLAKETDVEQYSSDALVGATPGSIVRHGPGDATDRFYLAAGNLFHRGLAMAANAWDVLSLPAEAPRCLEAASDGTLLLAALRDADYLPVGLFGWNGNTWEKLGGTAFDAMSIERILVLNGTVFLSVTDGTDAASPWKLLRLAPDYSVAAVEVSLGPVTDSPWENGFFRDGAWDGSEYWFIAGFSLYHGTAGAIVPLTGEAGMPEKKPLKSLEWSSALGRLLVATGSGMRAELTADETDDPAATELLGSTPGLVYARLSADGSWEASAPISLVSGSDPGYANFTDLAVVLSGASSSAAGAPVLIVGSESSIKYGEGTEQDQKAASARGYATIVPSSSSISGVAAAEMSIPVATQIASWSNFETTLYPDTLIRLVALDGSDAADGSETVLFALTAGDGLWSNQRDTAGAWTGWLKE